MYTQGSPRVRVEMQGKKKQETWGSVPVSGPEFKPKNQSKWLNAVINACNPRDGKMTGGQWVPGACWPVA